jgi:hypothetical protein
MVWRMILRYISIELYHRIVIEVEKFSPKFASRGSNKQWLIYTYHPKNMQMAAGVLTSSLEQTPCKLFFSTQVLPKNRGACVDIRFWHGIKRK